MIRIERLFRVLVLRNAPCEGEKMMERRERQFETNDLGLMIFAIVAGWLLLFQSVLF
jgi:hypothetical protein